MRTSCNVSPALAVGLGIAAGFAALIGLYLGFAA